MLSNLVLAIKPVLFYSLSAESKVMPNPNITPALGEGATPLSKLLDFLGSRFAIAERQEDSMIEGSRESNEETTNGSMIVREVSSQGFKGLSGERILLKNVIHVSDESDGSHREVTAARRIENSSVHVLRPYLSLIHI